MYLVGQPHPNRDRLESYLRDHPERHYVTSAGVYQEIVHRYVAIERRGAIDDAFDLLDALVEQTFSIHEEDVRRAAEIAESQHRLSGRDTLHLAVMARRDIEDILSCHRGFDFWPDVTRQPTGE